MASITGQAIELGGNSVSIPSSNGLSHSGGTETQQLGSWTVSFSVGQFQQQSSSCGSDNFNCFKQAAQTFIQSAGTLTDSLGKVGASMIQDGFYTAWHSAGLAEEASSYATSAESISEETAHY